jgi:hypothetical protein
VIRRVVVAVGSRRDEIRQRYGMAPEAGGCILMTRIGIDLFAAFGLLAEPWPVWLRVGCPQFVKWEQAGAPIPQPADAYVVLACPRGPEGLQTWTNPRTGTLAPRHLGGHVVVHLPDQHQVVDLDAGFYSRPSHGLTVPPVVALEWRQGWPGVRCPLPAGGELVMEHHPELTSYREASLWHVDTGACVRQLARQVRGKEAGRERRS